MTGFGGLKEAGTAVVSRGEGRGRAPKLGLRFRPWGMFTREYQACPLFYEKLSTPMEETTKAPVRIVSSKPFRRCRSCRQGTSWQGNVKNQDPCLQAVLR